MVVKVGKKAKGKSGGSGFVYKKRSVDDVKKRAEQSGGRFDSPFKSGFDVFRPKDGESLVRILPATWEDHDHYGLDVWMHRFIGADESNYLCLEKMLNKPCPACDEAKAAKAAGEDEEAKGLQAVKRTLVWVIDRDDESKDGPTPQIWDMSWAQDRDISALCHQARTGKVLLIDHPDDGYDLTIKKSGKGLRTRYTFIVDRDSSPIHDDSETQDKILEYITENPLPDVLRYDTAAHIEKQLSGTSPSKDKDEDEEDAKPAKRRGRDKDEDEEDAKPAKRRGRDKDEEDEEEEEKPRRRSSSKDKDEEDEEDEKPRRRSSRDKDEEDEEDEKPARRRSSKDADEEEEEEKPRRRASKAKDEEDEEEEEEKPRRRSSRDKDEEDEEEEEEKPRRRSSKPKEDEEDEEDEKPARRRR